MKIGIGSLEKISVEYFIRHVIPIGFITIVSVIFTNLGLDQADVATVNFAKSTGPIFTAALAWLIMGRQEPFFVYPLFFIVMLGVFFALHVDLMSGLRWATLGVVLASSFTRSIANVLSELLVKKEGTSGGIITPVSAVGKTQPTLSPGSIMFYSNPVEVLTLLPLVLAYEAPNYKELNQSTLSASSLLLLIILDSFAVFTLRLVTLHTLKQTSSLAITVFAQIKFAVAIFISTMWFDYTLDWMRLSGATLVVVGTGVYGYMKRKPVT
jgi:drug/metabolite transporter (DMT)-like permease